MASETKFGVLLPHFSKECDRGTAIEAGIEAERLGFDSVWVRDHVFIPPEDKDHGGITEDTFLEPLLTLSALSSVTEEIDLGTAILWPCRHPIKLAQNVGTLSFLSDERVHLGFGPGRHKHEFDALDIPYGKRPQLIEENFEVVRRLLTETDVSHDGELYEFEDVTINPRPAEEVPIWYGGGSVTSVRRAARIADGWLPGRLLLSDFERKMELLREEEANHGRDISVGFVPLVSVDETTAAAEERLNFPLLIQDVNKYTNSDYTDKEEIRGYFIAGTPEECAAQLQGYLDAGMDYVVFDYRHSFEDVDEQMRLTAEGILPRLR